MAYVGQEIIFMTTLQAIKSLFDLNRDSISKCPFCGHKLDGDQN